MNDESENYIEEIDVGAAGNEQDEESTSSGDDKDALNGIPVIDASEHIEITDTITGPNVLRKIGYVKDALGVEKVSQVRYYAMRYRKYLDLRVSQSKKGSCGLLLFHDYDVEVLRQIISMRAAGAKESEIISCISDPLGVLKTDVATADATPQIGFLNKYLMDYLLPKIEEANKAAFMRIQDEMKAANLLLLEDKNKENESLKSEIDALRKDLEERDKHLTELMEELRESQNKKKGFLGLFSRKK